MTERYLQVTFQLTRERRLLAIWEGPVSNLDIMNRRGIVKTATKLAKWPQRVKTLSMLIIIDH
jgi:hypothetical protein